MNFSFVKLSIFFILLSTNVFAGPMEPVSRGIRNLLNWNKRRVVKKSVKENDIAFYEELKSLSESQKNRALDIIAEGEQNPLYSALYSHLELNGGLIWSISGKNPKTATERIIISLVSMENPDNWLKQIEQINVKLGQRSIFLGLWDVEPARVIIADSIRREHLINNPELLLRWWQEGFDDRLVYFMHSSMTEIARPREDRFDTYQRFLNEDPFGKTVLAATRNSENFKLEVRAAWNLIDTATGNSHTIEGVRFADIMEEQKRLIHGHQPTISVRPVLIGEL